jgi:hypothetical protein
MQVAVEVELAFDDDHVLPWSPSAGTVELGDIFQTSCRFFTMAKDAPLDQIIDSINTSTQLMFFPTHWPRVYLTAATMKCSTWIWKATGM